MKKHKIKQTSKNYNFPSTSKKSYLIQKITINTQTAHQQLLTSKQA
ncbi:hypothetical protein MHSWG343_10480 [Candidatus Mycoplasma haematohominis]|uniref:Uncharacterized protein n=1 Tax=Candidatus Mycoplasma haematohominis TaxID=1494318 RepID=A0A478FVJ2_9MOLU|nr:hypothetical protein MHSWG343_10480 [Candidatus Mycoplasma haemohominis]